MKNYLSIKTLFLLLTFIYFTCSSKIPLIAIYSNNYPSDDVNPVKSQVGQTYVNWIKASGGEIVVIHSWDTNDYINYVLSEVDGVLFQGGSVDISPEKSFAKTANYILRSIIELHDKKIKKISIWATCLGFELISNLIEGKNVLSNYEAVELTSSTFSEQDLKNSKMFRYFSKFEFEAMRQKVFNEHHVWGISPSVYPNSTVLKDFFTITTTSVDKNGKEYINSIEAKNYPIFATQHHPEKTSYDMIQDDVAASSLQALFVSRALGNAFMFYAKQAETLAKSQKIYLRVYLKSKGMKKPNVLKLIREEMSKIYTLRKIIPRLQIPTQDSTGKNLYYIFDK
jgi:gamma-glutamyl hydrolase